MHMVQSFWDKTTPCISTVWGLIVLGAALQKRTWSSRRQQEEHEWGRGNEDQPHTALK